MIDSLQEEEKVEIESSLQTHSSTVVGSGTYESVVQTNGSHSSSDNTIVPCIPSISESTGMQIEVQLDVHAKAQEDECNEDVRDEIDVEKGVSTMQ